MGRQVRSRDHAGQSSERLFRSHPLIERVRRDDAATLLHRFSPGRCFGDRLSTCIDCRETFDIIERFGKKRHQAPTRQHHLSVTGFPALSNDWLKGCRRYVVVRTWHRQLSRLRRRMEVFRDLLFVTTPHIRPASHKPTASTTTGIQEPKVHDPTPLPVPPKPDQP